MTGAGASAGGVAGSGMASAAGSGLREAAASPRAGAPAQADRGTAVDGEVATGHPASGDKARDRTFADLLEPTGPAVPPMPARATAEADAGPATDTVEPSPEDLLALLDGHWFGAPSSPSPPAPAPASTLLAPAAAGGVPTDAGSAPPLNPFFAAAGDAAGAGQDAGSNGAPPAPGVTAGAAAAAIPPTAQAPAKDATAAPSALPLHAATDAATAARETAVAVDAGPAIEAPSASTQAVAPLPGARPTAAAALPPLPMPLHPDAGFDDGFGSRVAWMVDQRVGHAEIRLNPEHVGPIDVHVQLDGDQVRAEFTSAHAEVRQAIEASLPRLRELLGQHGLQLGQADVGQRQAGRDGNGPRADGATAQGEAADTGAGRERAAAAPLRMRGLLDTYA